MFERRTESFVGCHKVVTSVPASSHSRAVTVDDLIIKLRAAKGIVRKKRKASAMSLRGTVHIDNQIWEDVEIESTTSGAVIFTGRTKMERYAGFLEVPATRSPSAARPEVKDLGVSFHTRDKDIKGANASFELFMELDQTRTDEEAEGFANWVKKGQNVLLAIPSDEERHSSSESEDNVLHGGGGGAVGDSVCCAEISPWASLFVNISVLTKYSRSLGVQKGEWVNVFGLTDGMLNVVPKPVHAVILLFPITADYDNFCKDQDDTIKQRGQIVSSDLYYMKQLIPNACGTVGVIHSLANNSEAVGLESGMLKEFLAETKGMVPYLRGEALHKADLAESYEKVAAAGQTAAPNRDDQLITHFVAFIHKDGHLYELDGRREFPVNHGPTNTEKLLNDAAKICDQRIKLLNSNPNEAGSEYRSSVVAYTTGVSVE